MWKRCSTWLVALAGMGALAVPSLALAGPVEELISIALHPKDPQVMAIRYQNGGGGIIYSSDAGQTWKLMCATMIAPGEKAEGPLRITGDGRTLLGVFAGMWQGADGGCDWGQASEFEGIRVSDVTGHPSDPDITFAVTGSGVPGMLNDIRRRDASGVWSDVGTKDDAILSRLRVAAQGSALRFYESGQRGMRMVGTDMSGQQVPNYLIRVSDDGGMNWTEHPIDVDTGTMRLEAVDPKQPDRIVVSIDRSVGNDSIMVSADKGATFTEYLSLSNLGGIAVAPDGRVWIGDFGNVSNVTVPRGLWFAPNLDTAPTKITGDYQVECLAYQPATDTLYACQRWAVGSVDQKTGAFSQLFALATAKDFVTCGGTDAAAVCKIQLCNAYCGPLHFAQAPLCAAYNDPMCGPFADGPPQVSGTAGNSAVGGSSAIGASGMSAVGGIGGATTTPPRTPAATKAGGCATTTPGPLTGAAGQMAFIGLSTMILWRRSRRREPRCLA